MHIQHRRHPSRRLLTSLVVLLTLVCLEPALANKFETISGGISGSSGIKREWLRSFFMVAAAITFLGALLAVVVPHRNALFLNFNNWKASFAILLTLTGLLGGAAYLI